MLFMTEGSMEEITWRGFALFYFFFIKSLIFWVFPGGVSLSSNWDISSL